MIMTNFNEQLSMYKFRMFKIQVDECHNLNSYLFEDKSFTILFPNIEL